MFTKSPSWRDKIAFTIFRWCWDSLYRKDADMKHVRKVMGDCYSLADEFIKMGKRK